MGLLFLQALAFPLPHLPRAPSSLPPATWQKNLSAGELEHKPDAVHLSEQVLSGTVPMREELSGVWDLPAPGGWKESRVILRGLGASRGQAPGRGRAT